MTQQLPAAVLWDMDGTLIDTEPYWLSAETQLVHSHGGVWTHEDGLTLVGNGLWESAEIFRSRGVQLTADEIVSRLTDTVLAQVRTEVPWRPGARELLLAVREAGIPTALVTMSVHRMAAYVAGSFGFDAFDVIVAGDDVTNSKPHPEPYLRAAQLLDVAPTDCVAFEDSPPGLASALASGATTIGVPLHVSIEPGPHHTVWPTLADKTLDDLLDVYRDSLGVTA
ncbi:HAD family hydrolase [Parafrigoribacterium humi]|uniref:HAD family hydrolase n=1 Tax=Parafrigoribacterium humi TaxID=3144664 RepID=UPI0032EACD63